ncbi:unnamed protein product [Rotaria socialis]|uniref:Uncharacterized protein n=1 Tax=Rotaria socialis TaxID=392032 RepID=A0A820F5M7_9BILA|nr:unnamed protein product [Rotaria socialis]CAF3696754.1 unnamed protein product [Rotaria socialis]CAF4253686.1 unnamed protein product [Rotaria socialis]CAF4259391.1 unnamed protein product [Rotaria socialis]
MTTSDRKGLTIVSLSSYLIFLISGNETKTFYPLTIQIKHEEKDTFNLCYNLTTNHSYYLTFRLFEHKQIKFGLLSPAYQYQERSIKLFTQYNISTESFIDLFFVFILFYR